MTPDSYIDCRTAREEALAELTRLNQQLDSEVFLACQFKMAARGTLYFVLFLSLVALLLTQLEARGAWLDAFITMLFWIAVFAEVHSLAGVIRWRRAARKDLERLRGLRRSLTSINSRIKEVEREHEA